MSKALLAESFGQRLLVIFTASSPFYVEQPHGKGSTLYKYPTIRCKNNLERSTTPNKIIVFKAGITTVDMTFLQLLEKKHFGQLNRQWILEDANTSAAFCQQWFNPYGQNSSQSI